MFSPYETIPKRDSIVMYPVYEQSYNDTMALIQGQPGVMVILVISCFGISWCVVKLVTIAISATKQGGDAAGNTQIFRNQTDACQKFVKPKILSANESPAMVTSTGTEIATEQVHAANGAISNAPMPKIWHNFNAKKISEHELMAEMKRIFNDKTTSIEDKHMAHQALTMLKKSTHSRTVLEKKIIKICLDGYKKKESEYYQEDLIANHISFHVEKDYSVIIDSPQTHSSNITPITETVSQLPQVTSILEAFRQPETVQNAPIVIPQILPETVPPLLPEVITPSFYPLSIALSISFLSGLIFFWKTVKFSTLYHFFFK